MQSPGIQLAVVDAATGRSLDSLAVVTVTDRDHPAVTRTGPLRSVPPDPNPLDVTRTGAGRWAVRVEVFGYRPWRHDIDTPDPQKACAEGKPSGVEAIARLERAM